MFARSESVNGLQKLPFFYECIQQVREQEQDVNLESTNTQNSIEAATDPFVWLAATSPKTLEKTPVQSQQGRLYL